MKEMANGRLRRRAQLGNGPYRMFWTVRAVGIGGMGAGNSN